MPPPATACPIHSSAATAALVATPSSTSPRVRYHAAARANNTQAGESNTSLTLKLGWASSTPTANTIIGTPMKWLAILRRSRW